MAAKLTDKFRFFFFFFAYDFGILGYPPRLPRGHGQHHLSSPSWGRCQGPPKLSGIHPWVLFCFTQKCCGQKIQTGTERDEKIMGPKGFWTLGEGAQAKARTDFSTRSTLPKSAKIQSMHRKKIKLIFTGLYRRV